MLLVICNNAQKSVFLWEPEKINGKLHEMLRTLPVVSQFLCWVTFIFLDSHKKFPLVLLHITNYIYSMHSKKCKRECNTV